MLLCTPFTHTRLEENVTHKDDVANSASHTCWTEFFTYAERGASGLNCMCKTPRIRPSFITSICGRRHVYLRTCFTTPSERLNRLRIRPSATEASSSETGEDPRSESVHHRRMLHQPTVLAMSTIPKKVYRRRHRHLGFEAM